MTEDPRSYEDEALEAALRALPEPELPAALSERLEAIPSRGKVRRLPGRSWRIPAIGWAAAAAIGLFVGAQTAESDDTASNETSTNAPGDDSVDEEDDAVALAIGSFTVFEEEP